MQHGRTALQKIMGELLDGAPANEAPFLAWPLVCGPGVAKRTRVLGFRGGVLRVEVPDVAWKNQLGSLAPKYLDAFGQITDAAGEAHPVPAAGRDVRIRSEMKVTEKDVQYVADLANLELTPEEQSRMVKDLNSILEHIDRLNQLDTKDVPPMAQTSDKFGIDPAKQGSERFGYVMREDEVRPCLPREVVMENAPDSDGAFFKVPKVIER